MVMFKGDIFGAVRSLRDGWCRVSSLSGANYAPNAPGVVENAESAYDFLYGSVGLQPFVSPRPDGTVHVGYFSAEAGQGKVGIVRPCLSCPESVLVCMECGSDGINCMVRGTILVSTASGDSVPGKFKMALIDARSSVAEMVYEDIDEFCRMNRVKTER